MPPLLRHKKPQAANPFAVCLCLSCETLSQRDLLLLAAQPESVAAGAKYFFNLMRAAREKDGGDDGTGSAEQEFFGLLIDNQVLVCLAFSVYANSSPAIRYHALRVLVAFSASRHTDLLVTSGSIHLLARALHGMLGIGNVPIDLDYRDSLFLAIANVAYAGHHYHLLVQQLQCLGAAARFFKASHASLLQDGPILQAAAFMLFNVTFDLPDAAAEGDNKQIQWQTVDGCVDFAVSALYTSDDPDVLQNLVWFLGHLAEENPAIADEITKPKRWLAIVRALHLADAPSVNRAAVTLIGRIASCDAPIVQRMLRPRDKVLQRLHEFACKVPKLQCRALYALSNIIAEASGRQLDAVIEAGFVPVFVDGLSGTPACQQESLYCLSNLFASGKEKHIAVVCSYSRLILPSLCKILQTTSSDDNNDNDKEGSGSSGDSDDDKAASGLKNVISIMEAMLCHFDNGQPQSRNPCLFSIAKLGAIPRLRELAQLQTDVGEKASKLFDAYFSNDAFHRRHAANLAP